MNLLLGDAWSTPFGGQLPAKTDDKARTAYRGGSLEMPRAWPARTANQIWAVTENTGLSE